MLIHHEAPFLEGNDLVGGFTWSCHFSLPLMDRMKYSDIFSEFLVFYSLFSIDLLRSQDASFCSFHKEAVYLIELQDVRYHEEIIGIQQESQEITDKTERNLWDQDACS